MQAYIRTWGLRLGVAAAIVALAGCASEPASPAPTSVKPYPFKVMVKADGGGEVVRIAVIPNDGNVRIKLDPTADQILTWESASEFVIKFKPMPSDSGQGGDDLGGPGQWANATRSAITGKYEYSLRLNRNRPPPGSGTYTTKYHLKRKAADTYELDPVVIVDR